MQQSYNIIWDIEVKYLKAALGRAAFYRTLLAVGVRAGAVIRGTSKKPTKAQGAL